MLQSHIIDVDGVFVGTVIRTLLRSGHRWHSGSLL